MARKPSKRSAPSGRVARGKNRAIAEGKARLLRKQTEVQLAAFNNRLSAALSNATVVQAATVQRVLAMDFLRAVIPNTPVDTGRARGGWQLEVGSIPKGQSGIYDKNGSTVTAIAKARVDLYALGVKAQAQVVGKSGKRLRGVESLRTVWIANNVPYIEVLDKGQKVDRKTGDVVAWSKRGSGFFLRALEFLRSRIKRK